MNTYKVYAGNKEIFVQARTRNDARRKVAKMLNIPNWRHSTDAVLWEKN